MSLHGQAHYQNPPFRRMRGKSRIQASCLIMIHDSVILIRCNNPCKPTARGVSPKAPGPFSLPGCYSNRKRSHHEPVDMRRLCMELVPVFQAHPSPMSSVLMIISRLFFFVFQIRKCSKGVSRVVLHVHASLLLRPGA